MASPLAVASTFAVVSLVFAVPFVLAALLTRGHRWVVLAGLVLVAGFWLYDVLEGCNEDFEVECSAQPIVFIAVYAIYGLAPWLMGVGAGYLVSRGVRKARS